MKLFLPVCLFFVVSCGDDNFKKYASLSEFRVLGVVADTPEVSDTNETVSLTPVLSDIGNEGRTVTMKVESCVDPGIATGEEVNCEGGTLYQLVTEENIDINTLLGANYYTGAINSIDITIPENILSDRSPIEQFNGIDYIVTFTFSVGGDELLRTFRRIKVSSRPVKNSNPTISSISDILLSSSEQGLSLVAGESPQEFSFLDLTGEQKTSKEVYYLSWFTSSGEIESSQVYVDEETKITLDSNLPNEAVVVVFLRDGRGGSDFLVKKLP